MKWYSGRGSNPHARRHWNLNPACLPIPPPEHFKDLNSGKSFEVWQVIKLKKTKYFFQSSPIQKFITFYKLHLLSLRLHRMLIKEIPIISITMTEIEFQGETIMRWQAGASTFLAHPTRGARLMNWHVNLADGSVRDIIHWPNDAKMENIAKVRGGNPILFPFAARTFHKGKQDFWKSPSGEILPMPMHGLTRQGTFEITRADDTGFTATFMPTEADKQSYPFKYAFSVSYFFKELFFSVDLKLHNLDKEPIPWGAGHHFYFPLPWHEGLSRSDYHLHVPAKKAFYQDGEGKLVSTKLPKTGLHFGMPEINDCIQTNLKSDTVEFGPANEEENIKIQIGSSRIPSPWTTLVSWAEHPDSPFYCVEPWMCPPNSPEHQKGLRWVDPGKTDVFSVKVEI